MKMKNHFNNKKPLINLKILNKVGKRIDRVASRKSKQIFNYILREKNEDYVFLVRVNYGNGFINEGEYNTKTSLRYALRAFLED
ncbi:MAG: hypothetical protein ABIJ43_04805 [Candidatus Beckwithbacteria bacterium]